MIGHDDEMPPDEFFGDVGTDNVVPITSAKRKKAKVEPPTFTDWRSALLWRDDGTHLRRVPENAIAILGGDEQWKGVLAWDAFRECVVTLRLPPWDASSAPTKSTTGEWTESDATRCQGWLSRHHAVDLPVSAVDQAVAVVAERRIVHPVRDWLGSLAWDETARVDDLFPKYFGAETNDYTIAIGARFLIGAVARVYKPGCKVDTTPVLEGLQGIGKSTAVNILAGEWFFDTPTTMGEKDSYQTLRGKWIGELSELDSLNRSEVTRVKAFLSARVDTYRPSFARRSRDFARQCVFVATTNASTYLKDETGGRRFWPVRCRSIDLAALRRDRDQLWAEARVRFERGEAWHVDSAELAAACSTEQEERFVLDPWETPIATWLARPDRQTAGVTTTDVIAEALNIEIGNRDRATETRVGSILRRLKWESGREMRAGQRVRVYRPANLDNLGQPSHEEVVQ
jgi:putative DNA primase/helicase